VDIPFPAGGDPRWDGGMLRFEFDDVNITEKVAVGIAPSFTGHWSGWVTVRTCTERSDFDFYGRSCPGLVGRTQVFDITLGQAGGSVTGTWNRVPLAGKVSNGVLVLTGTSTFPISGGTTTESWVQSAITRDGAGRMSGTFTAIGTTVFSSGAVWSDMRTDFDLVSVTLRPAGP